MGAGVISWVVVVVVVVVRVGVVLVREVVEGEVVGVDVGETS